MMMVSRVAGALSIPVEIMGSMPPEMEARIAPATAEVSAMIAQELTGMESARAER